MPETTLPSDASSRPGKTVHFGDDVFDDVFDENQMASSSENKPPQTLLMTVHEVRPSSPDVTPVIHYHAYGTLHSPLRPEERWDESIPLVSNGAFDRAERWIGGRSRNVRPNSELISVTLSEVFDRLDQKYSRQLIDSNYELTLYNSAGDVDKPFETGKLTDIGDKIVDSISSPDWAATKGIIARTDVGGNSIKFEIRSGNLRDLGRFEEDAAVRYPSSWKYSDFERGPWHLLRTPSAEKSTNEQDSLADEQEEEEADVTDRFLHSSIQPGLQPSTDTDGSAGTKRPKRSLRIVSFFPRRHKD